MKPKQIAIAVKNIEDLSFTLKQKGEANDFIVISELIERDSKPFIELKENLTKINAKLIQSEKEQAIKDAKNKIILEYKNTDEYKKLEQKSSEDHKIRIQKEAIDEFKENVEYTSLQKKLKELIKNEKDLLKKNFDLQTQINSVKEKKDDIILEFQRTENYKKLVKESSEEYKKIIKQEAIDNFKREGEYISLQNKIEELLDEKNTITNCN